MIEFTVPSVPVAQPRHRICVVNGKARAFEAKKEHPIHSFKAAVITAFISWLKENPAFAQFAPLQGPVKIEVIFVMPRPKNMIWKTKPMPREPHTKKPDTDNLIKGLKDALSGLAWRDDSQVYKETVEKYTAADDEVPHVEVLINQHQESFMKIETTKDGFAWVACTKEHPIPDQDYVEVDGQSARVYHPDAGVVETDDSSGYDEKYRCPHCGKTWWVECDG